MLCCMEVPSCVSYGIGVLVICIMERFLEELSARLTRIKIKKENVNKRCAFGKHVKSTFPNNEDRSRGSLLFS